MSLTNQTFSIIVASRTELIPFHMSKLLLQGESEEGYVVNSINSGSYWEQGFSDCTVIRVQQSFILDIQNFKWHLQPFIYAEKEGYPDTFYLLEPLLTDMSSHIQYYTK